jgi:predicted nucleotidyltransferase
MDARDTAERIVDTLRAHAPELRAIGIRHLSLFGSMARGDAGPGSDVDLLAELDPAACIDLFGLAALQQRIADLLGRDVDLLSEPVEKARLRARIEQDRVIAF